MSSTWAEFCLPCTCMALRSLEISFVDYCPMSSLWLWLLECYCRLLEYRHLIPAPVDRTSGSDWLYKQPWLTCQENKPSTSMAHIACTSKLRSAKVIHASMPRKNWWKSDVRSCILPGLPTHLVQELNDRSVELWQGCNMWPMVPFILPTHCICDLVLQ